MTNTTDHATMPPTEQATFGAGCFWCTEAVYQAMDGVQSVRSGYMGGTTENPSYRDICTGRTGHAEVVHIVFNPAVLPYQDLLDLFWTMHDPTTLNRQGADKGTQYRSVIFYHSDEQKAAAETAKKATDEAGKFADPVVTEIAPASTFYPAEDYHQDYYANNRSAPYCAYNITPKLKKLGLE